MHSRLLNAACFVVFASLLLSSASRAEADGPAQVAVFPVTVGNAALRELAAALDPVLVSKLQDIAQVRVATRPALDLPATQLAVDCVGQTRECLRIVSTQSGVDGLISPSLQLVGDETVLTLLYFDGRAAGDMNSVTRRYGGPSVERAALDDVPGMLRQLFGLPELLPAHAVPEEAPVDNGYDAALDTDPRPTAWPAVPVILSASGVALLGAGAALGLAARSSKREYAELEVDTVSDSEVARYNADRAETAYSNAKTQALLCNIGLIAGGALLATGATLWTLHLVERSERDNLAVIPTLGPGELALSIRGHFSE